MTHTCDPVDTQHRVSTRTRHWSRAQYIASVSGPARRLGLWDTGLRPTLVVCSPVFCALLPLLAAVPIWAARTLYLCYGRELERPERQQGRPESGRPVGTECNHHPRGLERVGGAVVKKPRNKKRDTLLDPGSGARAGGDGVAASAHAALHALRRASSPTAHCRLHG